jgi:hypothetical protein
MLTLWETLVSRRPPSLLRTPLIVVALAAIVSAACGPVAPEQPTSLLPDRQVAREAIQDALEEWRTSPATDTRASGRSMIFVDRQQQLGRRLRAFAILGDSAIDNLRRFVVKLALEDPEESTLAAFYVFGHVGEDPIWVYRAEEFDMCMNMEMMTDPPAVAANSSQPEDPPKASTGDHKEHHATRP